MNTDGNTDAVTRIKIVGGFQSGQVMVRASDYDTLAAKLAEVEAEKIAIAQKFDELHPDPALMARIIMTSIERECENDDLRTRAEAAEAMLPRAYRAGVGAGAVVAIEQAISAVLEEGGDVRSAAQYVVACICALPTPTIEQLKEMLKETPND